MLQTRNHGEKQITTQTGTSQKDTKTNGNKDENGCNKTKGQVDRQTDTTVTGSKRQRKRP